MDKFLTKPNPAHSGSSSPSTAEEARLPNSKKSVKPVLDKQKMLSSIKEHTQKGEEEKPVQLNEKGAESQGTISESMKQLLTLSQWEQVFKEKQEQLAEKENKLESLRTKKDQLESRISKVKMDAGNYKKKAVDVLVKHLKELYRHKREQNSGFGEYGYVSRDGTSIKFVEGAKFIDSRKAQEKAEKATKQINEELEDRNLKPENKAILEKQKKHLQAKLADSKLELERLIEIKGCLMPILKARLLEKDCQFSKEHWEFHTKANVQPLQLIHTGGCHEVYRCYDVEEGCYKAMKLFKHSSVNFSSNSLSGGYCQPDKHIIRSGILEQLNHPNLARINRVVVIERTVTYIVMEMVEGVNLAYQLAFNHHIKEQQAKHILFSILSALEYLSRKLVGIPIRPQNVLLGDNGGVKIIGLDEAKAPNESGHILVHNDPPVESQYIPPEYYRPSQSKSCQLSNKADVWAAGVLFVRMLLGTMPFDENLSPWERDIKGVDIKALSKPRSIEISDQAKNLIADMLTFNEKHRKTAHELLAYSYFQ